MNSNIREEKEKLFNEWKQCITEGFVKDGVVCEKNYKKLLFLLKEVNDRTKSEWDLRDYLSGGARWQTWNNVTRWVQGLLEVLYQISCSAIKTRISQDDRKKYLSYIAAVNLKKTGGKGKTNKKELEKFVSENKNFLIRQFKLYQPEITICCGTFDFLKDLLNEQNVKYTKNNIGYFKSELLGIVIGYEHPQTRKKSEELYDKLKKAIEEIISK